MKAARIIVTKCHERARRCGSARSIAQAAAGLNDMGRLPFAAGRRRPISHGIPAASQDVWSAASSHVLAFFPAGSRPAQIAAPRSAYSGLPKDWSFLFSETMYISSRPASAGGACRDRHETWGVGCDGRNESQRGLVPRGRTVRCARRNRAVLTPRRWCPASRAQARCAHGGQQARRTRETTYKPFQPLRRGGRAFSARPVVPAACIFFAGGPRARPAPGLPCALHSFEGGPDAQLGREAPRETIVHAVLTCWTDADQCTAPARNQLLITPPGARSVCAAEAGSARRRPGLPLQRR